MTLITDYELSTAIQHVYCVP